MTSIEAVSGHVPSRTISIDRCLADEGLDRQRIEFHKRIFGNVEIRRDPETPIVDAMLRAIAGLDELRGREHDVRYLVYARTIQLGAHGANPLRELRTKLGLTSAVTFSVSQQACASGLLAVDVCGRLLAADEDPRGMALVIAGEKTFSPVTRLMGPAVLAEGVAAVLVGSGDAGDPVLGYAQVTHSEFADPLGVPPDLQERFNELNPDCLADVITSALAQARLTPTDIAMVLPHNVNRTGWSRVAHRLDLPLERIFLDHLESVGHNFCADSFLGYRAAVDQGRLVPGDYYVMTALGAGATWAAMVFQYRGGRAPLAVSSHEIRHQAGRQEASS